MVATNSAHRHNNFIGMSASTRFSHFALQCNNMNTKAKLLHEVVEELKRRSPSTKRLTSQGQSARPKRSLKRAFETPLEEPDNGE